MSRFHPSPWCTASASLCVASFLPSLGGRRKFLPFQRETKETSSSSSPPPRSPSPPLRGSATLTPSWGLGNLNKGGKNTGKVEDNSWRGHRQQHLLRLLPLGAQPPPLHPASRTFYPLLSPQHLPFCPVSQEISLSCNLYCTYVPSWCFMDGAQCPKATLHFSLTFCPELHKSCQGPSSHLTRRPLAVGSAVRLPFVMSLSNAGQVLKGSGHR